MGFSRLHFKEAVYFLPVCSQKLLVLILLTSKDERLSRPLSHPVDLSTGPLDWESSILTTRPLPRENFFTQFSTRIYWNTSLAAPDLFPIFTQSMNFCILYCYKTKEYRCLKNVIHQLEINKWLLLSAFQQGFQLKLSWSLSSCRKMLFVRGFILKPTERA